jgi:hypothetical protein
MRIIELLPLKSLWIGARAMILFHYHGHGGSCEFYRYATISSDTTNTGSIRRKTRQEWDESGQIQQDDTSVHP